MAVLNLRIGARSSRLSRAQAAIVSGLLRERFGDGLALEFVPVRTRGDGAPTGTLDDLGKAGAKGAFTSELEALLSEGKIDVAIHSLKDLPSGDSEGLAICATPPRGDPRDALVSSDGVTLETLARGARVGTSSLRRKAQLLAMRRDLDVVELHGNVDTRLRRVAERGGGGVDAVVLAVAGLLRLGEGARISQTFAVEDMVPAVGQGIIAVQTRRDDAEVEAVVSKINDEPTGLEALCERAFAQRLGADCNVPAGGCARVSGRTLTMVGMLATEEGRGLRKKSVVGHVGDPAGLGRGLAESMLEEVDAS